ncbi:hypothetical protein ACFE04_014579 [Oxalis oulophora]
MNTKEIIGLKENTEKYSPEYLHEQPELLLLKRGTEHCHGVAPMAEREIEELRSKMATVSIASSDDNGVQKLKDNYLQKLNALGEQTVELKRKLIAQNQLSTQKRQDTAAKNLNEEIQRLKAQKVQLQCKMKLESVQFRLQKAALEKEVLQLKKDQRRNKHETHKLMALNQLMKLVLQRKTTAVSVSRKTLQELLESRKAISRRRSGGKGGNQESQRELEATLCVQEVCAEYERQMEEMLDEVNKLKIEADTLEEDGSRGQSLEEESSCIVKDAELREMKEEVARLGRLVTEMGLPKPQLFDKVKPQAPLVESSASVGSHGSLLSSASESEKSVGAIDTKKPESKGSCCACSKKSLCKTTKCACRAARGSCGPSCGCTASKCSNRDVINLNDSARSEKSEISLSSADDGLEKPNNCRPGKKPLCNIKNMMLNTIVGQPGQKKRESRSVKQLSSSDLPPAAIIP